MQSSNPYDGVKTLIEALGGPSLDDNDFDAAAGLEAGRLFLGWLASQTSFLDVDGEIMDSTSDKGINVKLKEMTLEKDEVAFANDDQNSSFDEFSSDFLKPHMPPSKLQKHALYINEENDITRRQVDLLTLRISKVKEASKSFMQSIKTIQHVVFALDTMTRTAEEKVTELSFKADIVVATAESNVKEVFGCLNASSTRAERVALSDTMSSDLNSAQTFLLDASNGLSRTTSDFRNALDTLSLVRKGQVERLRDLQKETTRLQAAFDALSIGQDDEMSKTELRDICLQLENESITRFGAEERTQGLLALLSEADDMSSISGLVEASHLNVEDILRHAWARDLVTSLNIEEIILTNACNSLACLVALLKSLHSSIFGLVSCIQEAEAVAHAFAEELADIIFPESGNDRMTSHSSKEDSETERELRRILIENQGARPPSAPPLLLQTWDDMLAELQALKSRVKDIEITDQSLTEDLIRQSSSRPLHSALSDVYANSPLPSSPAFTFPTNVQELEARARKTATELQNLANSLDDECRSCFKKDSNIRRLDNFVEKWAGT